LPINKRLWTSSFALLSGGVSAVVLAVLIPVLDGAAARRLATPLLVLGGNAIAAFVLSDALGIFSTYSIFAGRTPQAAGFAIAQRIIAVPMLASLACAIAILALITMLLWPLHRRAIHFRL
jgi:predicted acyltransferase